MKNYIMYFLYFTLIACNTETPKPVVGEIYENKLTRERIKISFVGIGKDLRDSYNLANELWETIIPNPDQRLAVLKLPSLLAGDSLKECVAYEEPGTIPPKHEGDVWQFGSKTYKELPVTIGKIIPIEKLRKDYTKIE